MLCNGSIAKDYIIHTRACSSGALLRGSQHCKMLPQLFEKLLGVHMLGKGILRLLGGSVAALKISDLDEHTKKHQFSTASRKQAYTVGV